MFRIDVRNKLWNEDLIKYLVCYFIKYIYSSVKKANKIIILKLLSIIMKSIELMKFSELPIKKIGYDVENCCEVYTITSLLDARIRLSLKSYGFTQKPKVKLQNEKLEFNVWVKN